MLMITHEASPGGKSYCFPQADVRNRRNECTLILSSKCLYTQRHASLLVRDVKSCKLYASFVGYISVLRVYIKIYFSVFYIKCEMPRNLYTLFKRFNYISKCFHNTY